MSDEKVASWLIKEASRRSLTTEESRWLDHYYRDSRQESKCEQEAHPLFWIAITFLCGVAATLVILLS